MGATCGVQLKDRKRSTDFMLILGLNENLYQLAMANSVCWYVHVLRRDDSHVLRRHLILRLKVKGRKGGRSGYGKGRLRKKV